MSDALAGAATMAIGMILGIVIVLGLGRKEKP